MLLGLDDTSTAMLREVLSYGVEAKRLSGGKLQPIQPLVTSYLGQATNWTSTSALRQQPRWACQPPHPCSEFLALPIMRKNGLFFGFLNVQNSNFRKRKCHIIFLEFSLWNYTDNFKYIGPFLKQWVPKIHRSPKRASQGFRG